MDFIKIKRRKMGYLKNKILKMWYFHIKRDRVSYAKYLGVRVGERCQILADPAVCFGSEPWLIKIGNHVDVTEGVKFLNHEGGIWCARGLNDYYENQDLFLPITVGNNVMIGINSLIMPGVTIGNNVIIAGHSVVTKDIPDGTIVAGVPAKPISTIDKFMENFSKKETVPTKKMTQDQKRIFLQEHYPDWFK